MPSTYDLELDAIYRQIVVNSVRTVCVTAAHTGEGVSTVALALACRGTASGLKTLLVDVSLRRLPKPDPIWPARIRGLQSERGVGSVVTRLDEAGPDVLPAPLDSSALTLRDAQILGQMIEVDLAEYDLIVADTAPLFPAYRDAIPAEAVASVCATTVLVVLAGITSKHSVRGAVERLSGAGANLGGAVFNDRLNPSLADEIACELARFGRLAPGLVARLQRRVRRSAILNLQI